MGQETLLDTLRTLEVELHQAKTRTNRARLEELLHPEFVEVGSNGRTYSREAVLEEFKLAPPAYRVWSGQYTLAPLGDRLALLRYVSAHDHADGTRDRYTVRSSLWQQTDAGWRLRFHQGTQQEDR